MTYSEEFQPDLAGDNDAPTGYFEAFGVEFTSTVLGGLIAVLGLAGAIAIWWFFVKPMSAETELMRGDLQTKQADLQAKQASNSGGRIADLEAELIQEERIETEVINAYGKEKQIQTFLLDLNRILTSSNIQLVSYEPTPSKPEFIQDEAYGEVAKNKLKRQTFNVEFEDMTYAQVTSMLENLDLLQPLIVLRNFKTDISQRQSYLYSDAALIPKNPTQLQVAFEVDALIAPTPEELKAHLAKLEAEAAAAAPPAEGGAAPPAEAPPQ